MLYFWFSSENRYWHFMQIVSKEIICIDFQTMFSEKSKKKKKKDEMDIFLFSSGDSLHEMSIPVS